MVVLPDSTSNLWQGKSWFLSYLLIRRLLRGQPTAYRMRDCHCYLFDEQSKGKEVDMKFLFCLKNDEKRKLWILTSEPLIKLRWARTSSPWFLVLAQPHELRKSRSSATWQRDRNCGVRYMRNWEWHEIYAAFRYCPSFPFPRSLLLTAITMGQDGEPRAESDRSCYALRNFLLLRPKSKDLFGDNPETQ